MLAALVLCQSLITGAAASVNVALPAVRDDLGATAADTQWVVVLYQLGFSVVLITGGRLGDVIGRRRTLLVGLVGFVLGSLLAATTGSVIGLMAGRLVQGVFGALAAPQVLAIIQLTFVGSRRKGAFTAFTLVTSSAFMMMQIFAGLLLTWNPAALAWRGPMVLNLGLGLLALALAIVFVPDPPGERARGLDLGGVLLLSAGATLLLYPVIQGRAAGWPVAFLGIAALAGPVLWAFADRQRRRIAVGRTALLDPSLFGVRSFALGVAVMIPVAASAFPPFLYVTIAMQTGFGLSPLAASLVLAPWPLAIVFGSIGAPALASRLGRRTFQLCAGLSLAAVGLLVAGLELAGARPLAVGLALAPGLTVHGISLGIAYTAGQMACMVDIGPAHAGSASGVLQSAQQLIGAVAVAVLGAMYFGVLGSGSGRDAHVLALEATLGLLATSAVCLWVLARRLPESVTIDPAVPIVPAEG